MEEDKCPRCKQETVISLSNKYIGGGVLMCTKCKSVSPYAETTTEAMEQWINSVKKI